MLSWKPAHKQKHAEVEAAPVLCGTASVAFGVLCCCVQVAMDVCLCRVLRTDKRAPTEGAAREAKVVRRGSKAQQEEGGDAPEKDRRQRPEEKKVEEQLPSAFICT